MPGSHGSRVATCREIDDVINAARQMIDSTFDSPPEVWRVRRPYG